MPSVCARATLLSMALQCRLNWQPDVSTISTAASVWLEGQLIQSWYESNIELMEHSCRESTNLCTKIKWLHRATHKALVFALLKRGEERYCMYIFRIGAKALSSCQKSCLRPRHRWKFRHHYLQIQAMVGWRQHTCRNMKMMHVPLAVWRHSQCNKYWTYPTPQKLDIACTAASCIGLPTTMAKPY